MKTYFFYFVKFLFIRKVGILDMLFTLVDIQVYSL